jgi:hypothetical protein
VPALRESGPLPGDLSHRVGQRSTTKSSFKAARQSPQGAGAKGFQAPESRRQGQSPAGQVGPLPGGPAGEGRRRQTEERRRTTAGPRGRVEARRQTSPVNGLVRFAGAASEAGRSRRPRRRPSIRTATTTLPGRGVSGRGSGRCLPSLTSAAAPAPLLSANSDATVSDHLPQGKPRVARAGINPTPSGPPGRAGGEFRCRSGRGRSSGRELLVTRRESPRCPPANAAGRRPGRQPWRSPGERCSPRPSRAGPATAGGGRSNARRRHT